MRLCQAALGAAAWKADTLCMQNANCWGFVLGVCRESFPANHTKLGMGVSLGVLFLFTGSKAGVFAAHAFKLDVSLGL